MHQESRWSRRRFLATSAAVAAAASLPGRMLQGQTATYTRYNVASPEGKAMLVGYRTAIKAMLALPAADPCNWYRNVLVHTLDCPHGNWWFLPWHRGFIGYFEQTVRKYSGMANFAFPYWDWTTSPQMPADFFGADNPLDPTSSYFIKSYDKFRAEYDKPVSELYANFTPAQQQQLKDRGLSTPADLWTAIDPANPQGGYFFPGDSARCLTAGQPSFAAPPAGCAGSCRTTPTAVSPATITSALSATDFITFGSGIVDQHSQSTKQGVLEAQPHNQVHNCIGGFMSDLMSPTDPVFMMHHSNIERLWVVWTAKQEKYGLPTLPQGDDLVNWSKEPFLFYLDSQCQRLTKVAGDFATVGSFDYTYTPGFGSQMVKAGKRPVRRDFSEMAAMPNALVQEAAASEEGPELFAEVPIDPQGRQKGKSFHILINPPAGLDPTDMSSPHHAATVAFFGSGHGGHAHGVTIFVVQLSPALRKLKAAGKLGPKDAIQLFVAVEDTKERGKVVAKKVEAKISAQ